MSDQESRITQLEEVVAYQAKTIDELSDQLTAQWKVVEETRYKLERLVERFMTLDEETAEAPANAKPPHY
ncbi:MULTISPECIES: SlyX family protein [Rhizobium]|uniref:Protein SlyX homolog n=1 Tax=Rhizobium rhododendri TaxID=2506430 RepID=A0ABY8IEM9_9HYPH|nr:MULTISPECIES: SlyX family protein [Rhizobium]MBZ5759272.1 SlyX family protein [Rhizobium sp. VS19-DR96]MBZ5763897.1 SlyX family protein [Rhizobium sp. VS19-DR129.2]MBZ5771441.1 SlyX family protein [Rhizobium sp. VS19-DRK62.2]MBZ5783872.1 SlyX family protein [Rhizobium sp. VS19-DR121]MBZ5801454.1 SlyX family protein [Rhizobium sp. VS19-DR181]